MMSITAYWKTLIATFFILICIIAAGTFLFKFLESDWSFIDSAYFTASSVFTVGYGDLSVAPEHRAITGFFLIAACTLALASSSAIGNSFIPSFSTGRSSAGTRCLCSGSKRRCLKRRREGSRTRRSPVSVQASMPTAMIPRTIPRKEDASEDADVSN